MHFPLAEMSTNKSTLVAYLAACLTENILDDKALPFELARAIPLPANIPLVVPLALFREYERVSTLVPPRALMHSPENTLGG